MEKFDLHADIERRIYQPKKKSDVPKWLFFGALAIAIVGGALAFFNKDKMAIIFEGPGGTFVHFLKEPFQHKSDPVTPIVEYVVESRPVRPPRPVAVRPEDVTSPTLEQWEAERIAKEQAQRQTVFNDNNYTPKRIQNSMPVPKQVASYTAPVQKIRKFRNTHWQSWRWESYTAGLNRKHKGGQFSYVRTERGIDNASICANYKYGSLDYRDCRKAAKKHFQDACSSSFIEACSAGEMIP